MSEHEKVQAVAESARRILGAVGRHETSDSARVIYTEGDLNIAEDFGIIEIIYRGTLVFRYAPGGEASGRVFEEHGEWAEVVERKAQAL